MTTQSGPPNPRIVSGDEPPDTLDRMAYEVGVDVPHGYTRVTIASLVSGSAFLVISGMDLPAMALMFDADGTPRWTRAFPSEKVN